MRSGSWTTWTPRSTAPRPTGPITWTPGPNGSRATCAPARTGSRPSRGSTIYPTTPRPWGWASHMYQIERYMDTNTRATALMLDVLASGRLSHQENYGGLVHVHLRRRGLRLPNARPGFPQDQRTGAAFRPGLGTPLPPVRTALRAIAHGRGQTGPPPPPFTPVSKRDQEELVLIYGQSYKVPAVALRYFNVYGPRQALSNPYTGVAAIFSGRLLNRNAPLVFRGRTPVQGLHPRQGHRPGQPGRPAERCGQRPGAQRGYGQVFDRPGHGQGAGRTPGAWTWSRRSWASSGRGTSAIVSGTSPRSGIAWGSRPGPPLSRASPSWWPG